MADYTKEPWMDPGNNQVAAKGMMTGEKVAPVFLIGSDGMPSDGGGGSSTTNKGDSVNKASIESTSSSTLLMASNLKRVSVTFVNETNSNLYIAYGGSASTTDYTFRLSPEDVLIVDDFIGEIYGVFDPSQSGEYVRVTEVYTS